MIREWCEGCGDHLCSRIGYDGRAQLFCRDMCGSSDGPTINDVAAAFWSAIAHERETLAAEFGRGFGPDRKPAMMAEINFAPGPAPASGNRRLMRVDGVVFDMDDPRQMEAMRRKWGPGAHERAEVECLVKEARSEGLEEGLRRGPGPVVRFPEHFGYDDGPVVEEEEGEV